MKKKVFFVCGLIAIGAAVAFNANMGLRVGSLTDLSLANVEALAKNEDPEDGCKCTSYVFHHLHDGCYYDGCYCNDGTLELWGGTAECIATP